MAYTHFRYILYAAPTVALGYRKQGPLGPDAAANAALYKGQKTYYKIPSGNVPNTNNLQGQVNKLGADLRARLERVYSVLTTARASVIAAGDNNNTLKVFVLPEFYFRPVNKDQAYKKSEFEAFKDVIIKTFAKSNNNPFDNYLLVFGTILWRYDRTNTTTHKVETTYYNSCIYIRGNWRGGKVEHGIVEKTKASHIDGIPTGRHGGKFEKNSLKKSADEQFKLINDLSYLKKHIFKIGTIDIGIEICLEHGMYSSEKIKHNRALKIIDTSTNPDSIYGVSYGVLKKALNLIKNPPTIRLQILTAGGMPISRTSAVSYNANANFHSGFILRNDGFSVQGSPVDCKCATQYAKINTYRDPQYKNYLLTTPDTSNTNLYYPFRIAGPPPVPTTPIDYEGVPQFYYQLGPAITIPLTGSNVIPSPNDPNLDVNLWNAHTQQVYISPSVRLI